MDRRDFLKYLTFVFAGVIGIKSLLSLIAAVDIKPDLSLTKQSDNGAGSGYNKGRYNR